jgi:transcriptional regulator with XRE-family HTH domain
MVGSEYLAVPRDDAPVDRPLPLWSRVLRALREAGRLTQEGWAAYLAVSRSTVQRWERGETVPDPDVERAIAVYCRERGLFRALERGPLAGELLNAERLRDMLAESRVALGEERTVTGAIARPATCRLVACSDRDDGRTHVLGRGVTTIGRDADSTVVVAGSHVSRRHAELRWDGAEYVLHDLGSKNGTYLNGRRIARPERLHAGDLIALAGLAGPAWRFDCGEATITLDPDEADQHAGTPLSGDRA